MESVFYFIFKLKRLVWSFFLQSLILADGHFEPELSLAIDRAFVDPDKLAADALSEMGGVR